MKSQLFSCVHRIIHRTVHRKIHCNQYHYHYQYQYQNNKENIRKTAVCGLAFAHTSKMYELHKKWMSFLTYQVPVDSTEIFNISFGKKIKSIQKHFRGFQGISQKSVPSLYKVYRLFPQYFRKYKFNDWHLLIGKLRWWQDKNYQTVRGISHEERI